MASINIVKKGQVSTGDILGEDDHYGSLVARRSARWSTQVDS